MAQPIWGPPPSFAARHSLARTTHPSWVRFGPKLSNPPPPVDGPAARRLALAKRGLKR